MSKNVCDDCWWSLINNNGGLLNLMQSYCNSFHYCIVRSSSIKSTWTDFRCRKETIHCLDPLSNWMARLLFICMHESLKSLAYLLLAYIWNNLTVITSNIIPSTYPHIIGINVLRFWIVIDSLQYNTCLRQRHNISITGFHSTIQSQTKEKKRKDNYFSLH